MTKPAVAALELDALGTHWWIEALGGPLTAQVKVRLVNHISAFEQAYSRFSNDSLLGQLNRHKRLTAPPSELLDMLTFARSFQDCTSGVFNISVGGELTRRGYGRTGQGKVSASFWDEMVLTPDEICIPDAVSLDFGGFGKGWLIDQLGELLSTCGVSEFVINGGGDILVRARQPVELELEHPLESGLSVGTTRITQGALAVSSTIKRSWTAQGQRQHHIVDPRTAAPSSGSVIATYVQAETALIADACATVLIVEPGLESLLHQAFGVRSILVRAEQMSRFHP